MRGLHARRPTDLYCHPGRRTRTPSTSGGEEGGEEEEREKKEEDGVEEEEEGEEEGEEGGADFAGRPGLACPRGGSTRGW